MTARPLCIVAATGPGMGAAIARRFAREGFDLALLAREGIHAGDVAIAGAVKLGTAFDLDAVTERCWTLH